MDFDRDFFFMIGPKSRVHKYSDIIFRLPVFSVPLESDAGLSRKTGVFYRNTLVCCAPRTSLPLMTMPIRFVWLNYPIPKEYLVSATFFCQVTRSAAMSL